MSSLGVIDLIVWLLVLELMSFAVLPYLMWLAPNAPDRGYAFSKVCGLFVFGLFCWLPVVSGICSATNSFTLIVFTALLLIGYWGYRANLVSLSIAGRIIRVHALPVEGLFLGLTLLFAFVRFLNPEIVWGEKPMDSTFLNFFSRNTVLPPEDPWAAGSPMTYYYVGIHFLASVLKLTGIPGSIGYNLAISSLAGLIGASLYGLLLLLSKRVLFASVAAVFLVVASDPEVLRICFLEGKTASFDNSFWASTRVFTSPGFLEYTGWSLLFADLHAHVIAIPFTVTVLGLAALMFLSGDYRYSKRGLVQRVSVGVMLGALLGMNTWDFLTFGMVVALMTLTAPAPAFWKPRTRSDGSVSVGEALFAVGFARVIALPWDGILVGVGALLTAIPYQMTTPIGDRAGWGWVTTAEFNSFYQFMRVMGFQVTGLCCATALCALEYAQRRKFPTVGAISFVAVGSLLILTPPLLSEFGKDTHVPWISFAVCLSLAVVSSIAWWGDGNSQEKKVLHLFVLCGAVLIVILEIFYLMDRMNTLFKGYMAVWMLWGVASAMGLHYAGRYAAPFFGRLVRPLALCVAILLASLSFLGGVLNVKSVVQMQRIPERHLTLDGFAYVRDIDPDDFALIKWFNSAIPGTPTILEAQGESYRQYTRIAMHTGIPTVLGWEYHVLQRGLSYEALMTRKSAVREVYLGTDINNTKRILEFYGVDFIVTSTIERELYGDEHIEKFDQHPELFVPVVTFGQARVYVTSFSSFRSIIEGRQL